MIQVLGRAAALVERLAAAGPAGLPLRELAARAGLPPATCTRLLHDLAALGWADQQGPRGRYLLGPRLQALAQATPYRGRLLAAAAPVLERLAARHRASAVLAVLRDGRRLVLLETGRGGRPLLAERDDLYASASGRMLIAQLPWRERRRLVERKGLPRPGLWPGVATWPELNAVCAETRRQGCLENHPAGYPFSAAAAPVPDDAGGVAAIALMVERPRWSPALVRAARSAADAIGRRLAGWGAGPRR